MKMIPSPYGLETISDTRTQNVYRRNLQYELQVSSTTTGEAFAWFFNLNSCPDATALATLFDQYRVLEVLIEYIPIHNVSDLSVSTNVGSRVISVLDFDDAGTTFTGTDLLQYSTAREATVFDRQGRAYRPTARVVMSSNGGFATGDLTVVTSSNPANNWIDISRTNFEWLGTKWWFGGTTTAAALGTVYFKACVEFRQAR
jgi:hypothetical protein